MHLSSIDIMVLGFNDMHLFLHIVYHKACVRMYRLVMSNEWLLFNHIMTLSQSLFQNVKAVHFCSLGLLVSRNGKKQKVRCQTKLSSSREQAWDDKGLKTCGNEETTAT